MELYAVGAGVPASEPLYVGTAGSDPFGGAGGGLNGMAGFTAGDRARGMGRGIGVFGGAVFEDVVHSGSAVAGAAASLGGLPLKRRLCEDQLAATLQGCSPAGLPWRSTWPM